MKYHLYDENMTHITSGTKQDIINHFKNSGRMVACIDNQTIYKNTNAAARALSINSSQLRKHLNRELYYNRVKGLQFIYTDDIQFISSNTRGYKYAE